MRFTSTIREYTNKSISYAWLLWGVAAIFYAYEFALRLSITVMVPDLMQDFHLSPTRLGVLSATYFYAYALLQIPGGLLLDCYGVRNMLSLACMLVATGCLCFALANHFALALVGRFLIGAGSAFAFVGCLKLSAAWFPSKHFSLIVGLTNMLGVIGALQGQAPLTLLVNAVGWRATLLDAAWIGLGLALILYTVLRDASSNMKTNTPRSHSLWLATRTVMQCPKTWTLSVYAGLMVVPIIAFAELWSVHFFQLQLLIDKTTAAMLNSFIFVGIAVGGPIHGYLSSKLGQHKPIMITGSMMAMLSLSVLLYWPMQSIWMMGILLFLFGFSTSSMLLAFALAKAFNPNQVTGFIIGFINMMIMAIGILFQHVISIALDVLSGSHALGVADFHHALILLPLCQLFACVLLSRTKETHCNAIVMA